MAKNDAYFNTGEIIEACEKAKAETNDHPLSRVFSVETSARTGPNNTKYMSLSCTVPGKLNRRLMVRFIHEKHVGQIAPFDDAEVARINAERGDKYGMIKKRDRHPTINIQQYPTKVDIDDQGRAKGDLPDQISEYYKVIAFIDEFFYTEMSRRIDNGSIILRDSRRKEYPPNAIVVPSTKIVPMMQTSVSTEAKLNPGTELANPICRINMKFDKDTGLPAKMVNFYDFNKRYTDKKGGTCFEPLILGDGPVTIHNVHMIGAHSMVSGIANLNVVCSSNMGLSIPTAIEVLIVKLPSTDKVSVADVFRGNIFDDSKFGETVDKASAKGDRTTLLAASDNDITSTLDDLKIGDT